MHISFFLKIVFAAGSLGCVELLESMLLLSAEMDDGLGLLVTTRPHGKTAAQLLQRVLFAPEYLRLELWERAAQNTHVSLLEWLRHNSPALSEHEWHCIGVRAAQRGQVAVLKWIASCQPKYVFAVAYESWVCACECECACCYAFVYMYIS